ncbi:DUF2793 domain-containing protein [Pararhodobacter sp. SW119]|uniref:DUF2793 domain-containing protein n=1 Tax=Pararhodobacter sp. SW119 TaxID=2780075 RepID=UPI001ADF44DD|nr:DUF2793 domain-containing protein [Pararhodobacter sp. SW119]
MSENSPNLALPYLLAAQAQKHVTVNEALRILDAAVQAVVRDARDAPPASPASGDRHIVLAPATGVWAGWGGSIALFDDTVWRRIVPHEGWIVFDQAAERFLVFDGTTWQAGPLSTAQLGAGLLAGLGIAAAADATNRLAVASPAVLLTHAGAGHQLKINKASVGDTASVLFQSAFSGRAEMGLAGANDFSLKVSPDGAAWETALSIAAATGIPNLRTGATIGGSLTYRRANILGTVSQSAGVPTGAVIERGANASGEYVRFADGTQICTRQLNVDVTSTSTQVFPFPAAFAGDRQVGVVFGHRTGAPNAALRMPNIRAFGQGASGWALQLDIAGISSDPTSINETMIGTAIGRWF